MLNVPGHCSLWMQKQIGTGSDHRNGNRNRTFALLQKVPAAGCEQSLMYSADTWLLNIQVVLKQFSSLKNLTILLKSLIFYKVVIMCYYYYLMRKTCFIAFTT